MISGIETVKVPKDFSQTQYKINIYALDNYGFINIFCIDDFKRNLYALGLSSEYINLILNIMHANLVYGLAQKIGIMPGLFEDSDVALREYLHSHVSDAVEYHSKGQVVDDLIEAWNNVATHSEAEKQHILAGSTKDSLIKISDFNRFVYYEAFIESIFEMVLDAWARKSMKTFLPFYMSFAAVFYNSLSCQPLRFSPFSNINLLQKRMKDSIRYQVLKPEEIEAVRTMVESKDIIFDSPYSAHPIIIDLKRQYHPLGMHFDFVSKYSNYIQAECRTHITGWANIELLGLGEKYSKVLMSTALLNLLEGNIPVSSNPELREDLEALVQKVVSPSGHNEELTGQVFREYNPVFSSTVEPQKEKLVYQALLDAIVSFSQAEKICLQYPMPVPKLFDYLKLSDEEILDKLLQGDEALLTPPVLFSIFQTSNAAAIKETVQVIIQTRLEEERYKNSFSSSSFYMGGVFRQPLLNKHSYPSSSRLLMAKDDEVEDSRQMTCSSNSDLSGVLSLVNQPAIVPYFFRAPLLFPQSLNFEATQQRRETINAFALLLKAIKGDWEPVQMGDTDEMVQLVEQLEQVSLDARAQRKKTSFWRLW